MPDGDDRVLRGSELDGPHADIDDLTVILTDLDPVAKPVGLFKKGDKPGDDASGQILDRKPDSDTERACDEDEILQRHVEDQRHDERDQHQQGQDPQDRHRVQNERAQPRGQVVGQSGQHDLRGLDEQPDQQNADQDFGNDPSGDLVEQV